MVALTFAAHATQTYAVPTYTYTGNADNTFGTWNNPPASFSNSVDPPYVGSLSFSYSAASQLADGYYTFSALSSYSPSFTATFNNGNTFTLNDLISDPTKTGVYFSGSGFVFAMNSDYRGGPAGGSADFKVGSSGPVFSSEALKYNYNGYTLYSTYRSAGVDYTLYQEAASLLNYQMSAFAYTGN